MVDCSIIAYFGEKLTSEGIGYEKLNLRKVRTEERITVQMASYRGKITELVCYGFAMVLSTGVGLHTIVVGVEPRFFCSKSSFLS